MKTSIPIAIAVLCGLINAPSIQAQSGEELFQRALVMELSNGEVGLAIGLYQRIVMEFASDRSLAAKALIRLGAAQEARGSTEAKRAYQRIVSFYPDQPEQLVVARSRLAALATETVGGGNGEVRRVLQPSALCSDQSDSAIATFEDANLEVWVRSALLISAQEDLTCGLVSGLTRLTAEARPFVSGSALVRLLGPLEPGVDPGPVPGLDYEFAEIESLAGIQNLTSLTSLSLYANSITDISPLSGLTSLTYLSLTDNSIIDIGALSGLTSLTSLLLRVNSITDVSALSGLTSLDRLHLSDNSITDFSPLSGLTSLTSLHLHHNASSDISPLSGLTSLTHLYVDWNSISDISAVSGLTSLQNLSIDNNSITDISAVRGLTNLTRLDADDNSITDVSALSGLTGLTTMRLSRNPITDIRALRGLTSLTHLNLNDTPITDISALRGLTSLTDLRLHRNPDLSNIQPLLDNTGLGAGDIVRLFGTNVSCEDVAALRAKVRVRSDCP